METTILTLRGLVGRFFDRPVSLTSLDRHLGRQRGSGRGRAR
jgi:hypothetical protein